MKRTEKASIEAGAVDGGTVLGREHGPAPSRVPSSGRPPAPGDGSGVEGDVAVLELRDVSKSFGATAALRGVSLRVRPATFHALVGENGAGKSTIVKLIAGIHRADQGSMYVNGRDAANPSPAMVRSLGIGIVHQDSSVLPGFSVERNFSLGQEPTTQLGWINFGKAREELAARAKRFGVEFDPKMPAAELSTGNRKVLEILKVLDERQKLLVLDEPTASFTTEETRQLLRILAELKASGVAVLYVTHRLEEIEGIVDSVTVLRDGTNVGSLGHDEATPHRVISLMVGRDLGEMYPRGSGEGRAEVLYTAAGINRRGSFDQVDFEVHRGEIVAFVGLTGHGSFEVARSIAGLQPPDRGTCTMAGERVRIRSLRDARGAGIGFLSESRAENILRVRSVRENLALAALENWSRFGFVDSQREGAQVRHLIELLSIRCRSASAKARSLSGGNQQKLALGRWLAVDSQLMVLLDPTAGVDVGARADIYRLLREFADRGRGVLIATSDLAEAMGIADTIYAFYKGKRVGMFPREQRQQADVLAAITGHREGEEPA
jgi:ABC-type sugar transport system ATPase subunit